MSTLSEIAENHAKKSQQLEAAPVQLSELRYPRLSESLLQAIDETRQIQPPPLMRAPDTVLELRLAH
ncbi:hypothetical protein J3P77_11335 [Pseudomonas sp. R1-18]|uniref:hypothetical protein n=1 Tax=Pseudomonas sp. R1-18 TaxID=1632772 RepID=UPI003DA7E494